jgi:GWxTD domain-containing protein
MNRIKPDAQLKQKVEVDVVSYQIQNSDSFNVNILLRIPLKNLVFKKLNNQFIANISYTFNTNNSDTKVVVNRVTQNESIIVYYYEDTRDIDRYFQIETQIILPPGKYDLFSIIQDIDSHNIFTNTTKMDVGNMPMISKLTAFYNEGKEKYYIIKVVKEDIDTVWFKFQMNDFEIVGDKIPFNYKVLQDSTIIDSSTVNIIGNQQNIYNIPLKISSEWENDITVFIGNKGQFSSMELFVENKYGTQLWSDKQKDIIGVMAYLLPYSEFKKFSELDDGELFEGVTKYWKSKDPTSNTKKNELLIEINNRIAYANAHFSVVGRGWQSDMGKVYIVYGPPESIDRQYNAEYLYNYEIWYFSSGRKFTFSDQKNFGELKLVSKF